MARDIEAPHFSAIHFPESFKQRGRNIMSLKCANCDSLFFKTLETRVLESPVAVLYKKRCKRCKYKYLLKKELLSGHTSLIALSEWQAGRKVSRAACKPVERGRVFVSEYTGRISRAAETTLPYLQRIRKAGEMDHDRTKIIG
jgi:hypothetical protein